jgi:flagellar biosynthesis protein FliR
MSDFEKTTSQPSRISRGVKILIAVLIAWATLIAIGSFQTQASTDFRRPLIVAATMAVFLGIWIGALFAKGKR